ncbi:hypothetical protein GO988_20330 [Hymenobacter sp. HMF4947]|uniref:Beta-lactamase-inhibitor-like PepSY-like domain-containing protein n=1 Tax=Hymenobacter ginkgonis TaxID=2682976 RepID=A0A7K1TJV2_9BACT|nr:hypothetical protein [Hymenobacter ginkgonis]MVN78688.1 hypothetical protein [Hymenobacter ginkgonis]
MRSQGSMLRLISLLALPLLGVAQVPSCRPVQIAPDQTKRDLLRQFINDCHREHYFFEDKGVVELIAYHDAKGRAAWYLSALIDDRYRDNPPAAYSMQGNDIVLVYQGDSLGKQVRTPTLDVAPLVKCLELVIGPAVYQRPAIKERFVEETIGQKTTKYRVLTDSTGNLYHERRIVFNADGTYIVYNPA